MGAALALVLALAAPLAAHDAEWGVRPAHGAAFRLEASPGERLEDALVVTNHGAAPLVLDLFGADGDLVGDLVELAPAGTAPEELGTWLEVAPRLVLDGGEQAIVPFAVTVPAGTGPGRYAGALVTSSFAAAGDIAVDRRLAASIVVTVTGDEPGGGTRPEVLAGVVVGVLALAGLVVRVRARRATP